MKIDKLKNGLMVVADKNTSLHRIDIGFYFKCGSLYETTKNSGITYLTTHMFFRNLNGIPQEEIYSQMESIGADFKGDVYKDFACLKISASPIYAREAFSLIINILQNFSWELDDFENEKAVVKKKIELNGGQNFSGFVDSCYYKLPRMNRPIKGSDISIETLSVKNVNLWKRGFFNCSNCCCVFTGNYSQDDFDFFVETLELINSKPVVSKPIPCTKPKEFCKRTTKSDRIIATDWDFSDVSINFDVGVDMVDAYGAELLHSIIGQGIGSKLSLALRDTCKLTDEITSVFDVYKSNIRMAFEFTVHNLDLITALEQVKRVIVNAKTRLTIKDLENTKKYFTCNQRFILDSASDYNHYMGRNIFVLSRNKSLENEIEIFDKYGFEELMQVSQCVLKASNLTVVLTNNSKIQAPIIVKKALSNLRAELSQSGDGSVIDKRD